VTWQGVRLAYSKSGQGSIRAKACSKNRGFPGLDKDIP